MDLREGNTGDEQRVLEALFYALVLTIVPLFPARYIEVEVAAEKIRCANEVLERREEKEFSLLEVLEKILPVF